MTTLLAGMRPEGQRWVDALVKWFPVLLGLLVLYVPTIVDLANGLWNTEEQAHGPMILIVVLYLFWQRRETFLQPLAMDSGIAGAFILAFGLLLYAVGRSQEILMLEIGSLVPVLAGVLLLTKGSTGLRALWFAVFFTIFMIPLPGFIIDTATGPLKQHISVIAENVLYLFGYPIARSGVTITIGPYQLMVADACSGLHSMFSLFALGVLYLYFINSSNWLRNSVIVASILPIAFLANVVRVITLVLVTYYFGDDAGQGFIHGFAGMLLFVIALAFLMLLDSLLGKFPRFQDRTKPDLG